MSDVKTAMWPPPMQVPHPETVDSDRSALEWLYAELSSAEMNSSYKKETLVSNLKDRIAAAISRPPYDHESIPDTVHQPVEQPNAPATIDVSPGLYRHYKGNLYRALFVSRLSEHREVEVMNYVPLDFNPISPYPRGQPWTRPLRTPVIEGEDCWCDIVEWPDGSHQQRFTRIGD